MSRKDPKATKPANTDLGAGKTETDEPAQFQGSTDDERALFICDCITEGDSLRHAAWRAGMKVTSFMRMVAKSEDEETPLVEQYLRAREARADLRFEGIEKVIEDLQNRVIDPQSAKVLIDAKFRQIGKENAKRYGDKLDVTSGNKPIPAPAIYMHPKNATGIEGEG